MLFEVDYQMGGTNPISETNLGDENTQIAIDDIKMFDGAIFIISSRREIVFTGPPVGPSLEEEFEAWDTLSDEALTNFEATLN